MTSEPLDLDQRRGCLLWPAALQILPSVGIVATTVAIVLGVPAVPALAPGLLACVISDLIWPLARKV